MKRAVLLALAALALGLLVHRAGWLPGSAAPPLSSTVPVQPASVPVRHDAAWLTAMVVRALDGRTIETRIDGRPETVRYVGVELQGDRRDAAEFNRRFVTGQTVRLETELPERDPAGRLLAYVYVGEVMVNAELVAQGYARLEPGVTSLRHHEALLRLERQAALLRLSSGGNLSPDPHPVRVQADVASCPTSHPIKGTAMRTTGERCVYRTPDDPAYARARARRCYASEAEARQDGCRLVRG